MNLMQTVKHNQQQHNHHSHGCLRITDAVFLVNKASSYFRIIVENLFLIVVNWKNVMGPSRLYTPTFFPTSHCALVHS